jgi:hypothetical protein
MPNPCWSVNDDAMLSELAGRRISIDQIATQLHRSVSAVRNRAKRLGLKISKQLDAEAATRDFQVGQRVHLSTLGVERCPKTKGYVGHISAKGSGHSYYVLFDGSKSVRQLHCTYIDDGERAAGSHALILPG